MAALCTAAGCCKGSCAAHGGAGSKSSPSEAELRTARRYELTAAADTAMGTGVSNTAAGSHSCAANIA